MNIRRHIINMASASVNSASYTRLEACATSNHNIVVGLNGALQKRFVLPTGNSLVPGNVHRASHIDFGVGGKGQDVAIALHCLLEREELLNDGESDAAAVTNASGNDNIRLVQFIGTGFAGDTVHNLLKDRLGEETMEFTVRSSSELRTCTSIVAADETTELVEPSGIITNDEIEKLFSVVPSNQDKDSTQRSPRSLCIMGSMPPGCPEDTYARIYAQLAGPNTVCVVDSLAGIGPLLQTISDGRGAPTGPVLFKMNASELCKIAGTPKSNSETDGISVPELIDATEKFLAKYLIAGIKNESSGGVIGLAITDGKHDAYFVTFRNTKSQEGQPSPSKSFKMFQLPVPNLDKDRSRTLYPIGAGDAVAAGTVAAWTSLVAKDVTTATPSISLLSIIPRDSLSSLVNFLERVLEHCTTNSIELSRVQAQAVAAFAFGLACGSASCLQEENSVLDICDVNALFKETSLCPPRIVLTS